MKRNAISLVFFGNERIATGTKTQCPVLQSLIDEACYSIKAVIVSQETTTHSRSRNDLEIISKANEYNLPVIIVKNRNELEKSVLALEADIGVLVAFGQLVPASIISHFSHGIINIHPSLLPRHRGPTPIESVILQNEKVTGVSIMELASEMDAGPIYGQEELGLTGKETKQQLADMLLKIGASLLKKLLPSIVQGSLKPTEQNSTTATYDKRIEKSDGQINWSKTAEEIECSIRAYSNWPKSRAFIAGTDCVITKATAFTEQTNEKYNIGQIIIENKTLSVQCGNNTRLMIEALKPAGKNEVGIEAFLAGYKSRIVS